MEGDERGAVPDVRKLDGGCEVLRNVALVEAADIDQRFDPDQNIVAVAYDGAQVPRELPFPFVAAHLVRRREGAGERPVRDPDVQHALEDREVRAAGVRRVL